MKRPMRPGLRPPWSQRREDDAVRITFIEAHPSIFPSEEYIGEGKQARLDIAIDATAVRGKAEMPAQRPQQIPGQIGITDNGGGE